MGQFYRATTAGSLSRLHCRLLPWLLFVAAVDGISAAPSVCIFGWVWVCVCVSVYKVCVAVSINLLYTDDRYFPSLILITVQPTRIFDWILIDLIAYIWRTRFFLALQMLAVDFFFFAALWCSFLCHCICVCFVFIYV